MAELRLAERNKKAGVCYAVSSDGLELPVVDITHPAFGVDMNEARLQSALTRFLEEQRRFAKLPELVRKGLMRFLLRGSILGRGLRRAEGTYLDGMTTYLFKLGPKNLGAYALPADRRIAASLPALSVRLRLGDVSRLLVDSLVGPLAAQPGRPLHFVNIAGGPAIDSLNALILLRKEQPRLMSDRPCKIQVLDSDERGPTFGSRALAALQAPGAALHGLQVELSRQAYDWSKPDELAFALAAARSAGAVVIASSEGGLFEYGSDQDIIGNLRALAAGSEPSIVCVGSVTRNDQTIQTLKLTSRAATRPRGLETFKALARRAEWEVTRAVERPLSDQVVLTPRGSE